MQPSKALSALPLPARRALRKLGADLAAARKRRRLTQALVAERALTSRQTVARIEAGDPGVSMGIYAMASAFEHADAGLVRRWTNATGTR